MLPVNDQLPVAGLYSSALLVCPPATSTAPLDNLVAAKFARATCMLPVAPQLLAGAAHSCPCGPSSPASPSSRIITGKNRDRMILILIPPSWLNRLSSLLLPKIGRSWLHRQTDRQWANLRHPKCSPGTSETTRSGSHAPTM